jgi:hypothetical protein
VNNHAFRLAREAVPARIKSTQEMTQRFLVRFGQEIAAATFADDVHSRLQSFSVHSIPPEFVWRHPKIYVNQNALTRLTIRNLVHHHAPMLVRNEINNRFVDVRISPWQTVLKRIQPSQHSLNPLLLRQRGEHSNSPRQPWGEPTLITRLLQRSMRFEHPVNTRHSGAATLDQEEQGKHSGKPEEATWQRASRSVGDVRRNSSAAETAENRTPSSLTQAHDSPDGVDAFPPLRNREVRQRAPLDVIDLNTLTDRVVNAIDRRIVAQRERLGRW